MIRTLILCLLVFPLTIKAQNSEAAVRQSIETMFKGMHLKDTAMVGSVFAKDALLQTIAEERPTGAEIETGSFDDFMKSIASIPAEVKIEERLWSWKIQVDGHLATVWTEYTFFVNDQVSHCGVNAFQLFKEESGWKITKIIDTRYLKNCPSKPVDEEKAVAMLIDNWHHAAAVADEEIFFGSMAEDGIYIGTDKTERWLRDEMKEWAKKYFERESAWAFEPFDRNIYLSKDEKIAWWEEKLNTWMGVCMGSGVAVKEGSEWKIKHFHLGVTIDNDKIQDFIKLIEKD